MKRPKEFEIEKADGVFKMKKFNKYKKLLLEQNYDYIPH